MKKACKTKKACKMKKAFWCVHHVIVDRDGYYESIMPCSSKEKAEEIAGSISKGKAFILLEEKEI